jgi:L-fuculose-phosphate aldolase
MIAIGADLAKALRLAVEVETLAAQYWRTLQVGGPKLLSQDEIAVVLGKFATYGQQPGKRRGGRLPRRRG